MMAQQKPLIIIPCYNLKEESFRILVESLLYQKNIDYFICFAVDNCPKSLDIVDKFLPYLKNNEIIVRYSSKRLYALGNIVKSLYMLRADQVSWVGIVDGDDYLIDDLALKKIQECYCNGADIVWSNFLWDGKKSNLCQSFPKDADPYSYPWVSSHLKTFNLSLFLEVPVPNFLDNELKFYKRAYDHAIMLPMLWLAKIRNKKTFHLNEYLYYYNNSNSSLPSDENTSGVFENSVASSIRARHFTEKFFLLP